MHNNGHSSKADWVRDVMERYESPLIRYAASLVGDLDRGRDVVQDTFLKLCQEEPGELEGHLAEWLFTVCRNRALDVQRKENRMKPFLEEELEHQSSPEPPPDKIVELRDSAEELLQVLGTLSPRQQEIVRLKFQSNLSYAEIARITNLTASNVGFILHTAIREMRRRLKAQSPFNSPHLSSYEN